MCDHLSAFLIVTVLNVIFKSLAFVTHIEACRLMEGPDLVYTHES